MLTHMPPQGCEEDPVSPIDDDSLSNDCTDDSGSTFSDVSSLHSIEAIDNGNMIRAQSIKIVSVGKPKVVEVPASPTSPRTGYFDRNFEQLPKRPTMPQPTPSNFALTTSLNSIHDSIMEAVTEKAELAVPATPTIVRFGRRLSLPAPAPTQQKVRHTPTFSDPFPKLKTSNETESSEPFPNFKTSNETESSSSTDLSENDSSLTSRSSVESQASTPQTPSSPISLAGRKFNVPFIRTLGKSFKPQALREVKSIENLRRIGRAQSVSVTSTPPPLPPLQEQPRPNRPKMQARGANEREPTLRLPPCPDGYEAEIEFSDPVSLQRELLGINPLPPNRQRRADSYAARQWRRRSLAA